MIKDEDKDAYDSHLDSYFNRFKPIDQVEADTIRRAANSMRKYDRLTTIETTLLEWEAGLQTARADSIMDCLEPRHLWTLGFKEQCGERSLENCRRYLAGHQRDFDRAVRMFYKLKQERDNDSGSAASIPPETKSTPQPAAKIAPQKASSPNEPTPGRQQSAPAASERNATPSNGSSEPQTMPKTA